MVRRERWASVVFVIAATLLFHSHYPYWATLLAAVLAHAAIFHRDRWITVAVCSFCTFLLNLPWLVWLLTPPTVGQYAGTTFTCVGSLSLALQYLTQVFRHVFSPILLVLLALVGIAAGISARRFPKLDRATVRPAALLLLFAGINVAALTVLTPFCVFRYLAPVIPVLCLAAAAILDSAMRLHWGVGVMGLAVILFFSPISDYLYEITHHYVSPTEGIVAFLNKHGKPDNVVAMTYGDLPVKFYTRMRVVGGLTGEDLTPALKANWVIIRHAVGCQLDYAVLRYLTSHLVDKDYRRIELDYPDTYWDNCESPDVHCYRTVTDAPRVVIFHRIAR